MLDFIQEVLPQCRPQLVLLVVRERGRILDPVFVLCVRLAYGLLR